MVINEDLFFFNLSSSHLGKEYHLSFKTKQKVTSPCRWLAKYLLATTHHNLESVFKLWTVLLLRPVRKLTHLQTCNQLWVADYLLHSCSVFQNSFWPHFCCSPHKTLTEGGQNIVSKTRHNSSGLIPNAIVWWMETAHSRRRLTFRVPVNPWHWWTLKSPCNSKSICCPGEANPLSPFGLPVGFSPHCTEKYVCFFNISLSWWNT